MKRDKPNSAFTGCPSEYGDKIPVFWYR
jgi:hypothetical protein